MALDRPGKAMGGVILKKEPKRKLIAGEAPRNRPVIQQGGIHTIATGSTFKSAKGKFMVKGKF